MSAQATHRTLVLLVGSNPLPNYLAACALRPSRIALVHTKATEDAKNRLQRELGRSLGEGIAFDELLVRDATCATTVRRVLDPLMVSKDGQDVLLNYTGGTKVMAAHARMVFAKSGGRPEHASYLDEGGRDKDGVDHEPRLRFDDGNWKALAEYPNVPLTLATLFALHGITSEEEQPKNPAPTTEDAREILHKVLRDVPLAKALYCERQRLEELRSSPRKAASEPFRADRYGLSLSLREFPTSEHLDQLGSTEERKSWFRQWYSFIGGGWLEVWLGDQIRSLKLSPAPEVRVGVNAGRGEKKVQLEVDIVVIRGYRSYFISCTTDTSKSLCKSKLFEVAVRSRQLGGDLARAALVCLADDPTVDALEADIADLWYARNTPKVFGLSKVLAWSDYEGKQPNQEELKSWLES